MDPQLSQCAWVRCSLRDKPVARTDNPSGMSAPVAFAPLIPSSHPRLFGSDGTLSLAMRADDSRVSLAVLGLVPAHASHHIIEVPTPPPSSFVVPSVLGSANARKAIFGRLQGSPHPCFLAEREEHRATVRVVRGYEVLRCPQGGQEKLEGW